MKHHPLSAAEKADVYTTAKVRYTEANGTSATHDLAYHRIFATAEIVGGNMVGGPYDANDRPLTDNLGQMASDSPDGTSLLHVDGLVVPGGTGAPLAMVTQFEYRDPPPSDGVSTGGFWSKLPAATGLALLDQDRQSGLLTAKSYRNISFSGVRGGWIHCGSTLSAWGTHLGSEACEPDAKTRGGLAAATGTEIKGLVDGGIRFADIFLVSNTDPGDATYTKVTTYNGTEWLQLKPGIEKAAAFLETRRYAALQGATTEFSKMEHIAFNAKDRNGLAAARTPKATSARRTGSVVRTTCATSTRSGPC
jgi:hypothetical protein